MSSSKITKHFRRSIFPSRHTRQVLFLQRQNLVSRNSEPVPFQLLLYRPYTNSAPNDFEKWKFAWNKKWTPIQTYLRSINWKKRAWDTTVFLWSGGVIFFAGDLLYTWQVSLLNERLINETMEKGTRPKLTVSEDEYIDRPEIIDLLKGIFQPSKNYSHYHVICGEHGTGKTSLVRKVANEVKQGVIYVDIPPNFNEMGYEFGKALNFTFEEDVSLTMRLKKKILNETNDAKHSYSKWERAMHAFKGASTVYKKKHGKPPVIIYDNVNQLVPKHQEILEIFQDNAKRDAVENNYVAVFVTNEGSVPRIMESRSSWSRAKKPVEIGDFSEEESIEYLTKKRKINEVEAKKLYELVGGRIVELKDVADDFLSGQSFEGGIIKMSKLTEVKKKFDSAKLLRNQSNHEVGKCLIRVLLDSKEIDTDVFREYFKDKYGEVLEANVFAYHPSRDTVTFQSKSTEYYIRENANIFLKQGS
ncbi:hypothetical protein Glove_505g60 [Diversispora epigaea]|uniref:AAA+ ATPase domain-containing protein n=1 Tax=Diversispora epigaea TaxID=1348612 RepID=A0A397GKK3_9GLOM|nr:hypothetical protein Glove_505g60 [Diversispora epigaea]